MKRILYILFLSFSLSGFSQTGAEINVEAYSDYKKCDNQLNEVYGTILDFYNFDTVFVKNLKRSQRIWIQFRDAEMLMKYPDYSSRNADSIHPFCHSMYLAELTNYRIATLNNWVNGIEEGYVCNGSIRKLEDFYANDDMELAIVKNDSTISLISNMNKWYRIFGYAEEDTNSTKMILLSIFTSDVANNPFDCEYGAYYDTVGMPKFSLKYSETVGGFLEVEIIKAGREIDRVYMQKKWFVFQ